MSQPMPVPDFDLEEIENLLVTEDDEPVDNMFAAKQQRLLVESLYTAWTPPPKEPSEEDEDVPTKIPRPFLADANVGIFYSVHENPLVPDMFLSLDVELKSEWIASKHRSYFIWRFGKPPEVVVEIVSDRKGGEMDSKRKKYAQIGIQYYVVFDPFNELKGEPLYVYEIGFGKRYRRRDDYSLPDIGLSMTLWQGSYEEREDLWLRWLDSKGALIASAREYADSARSRADEAKHRADEAEHRADEAEYRANEAKQRAIEAELIAARELEAQQRAEAEAAQLRAELDRLRKS